MKDYERKAYYHETDQMGIIHHSNYFRWMEEARIDLLTQLGFPYDGMEKLGIVSPVIGVTAEYKRSVRFDETVLIKMKITRYNGTKLDFSYDIINKETGELCVHATSSHAFLKDGRIVSLKREDPAVNEAILKFMEEK